MLETLSSRQKSILLYKSKSTAAPVAEARDYVQSGTIHDDVTASAVSPESRSWESFPGPLSLPLIGTSYTFMLKKNRDNLHHIMVGVDNETCDIFV